MIEDRFLYCRNCNEAHHVTPFDRAPIYNLQEMSVEETFIDDRRQFVDRHAGHEMEELKSVAANYYYSGRSIDPMKVGYVEVTNGTRSYRLRASRETIADAISYKVVPGLWD